MCHLIFFENVPTAIETMTQKSSIYLLEISRHIFSSIFKTLQYPWKEILINKRFFKNEFICCSSIAGSLDMCVLKFCLKKHNFAKLNFYFKKLEKMAIKSLFLGIQNSFQLVIVQYLKKPLDQNSSFTPLWNNNWKL